LLAGNLSRGGASPEVTDLGHLGPILNDIKSWR
jgi:hypothetical protein